MIKSQIIYLFKSIISFQYFYFKEIIIIKTAVNQKRDCRKCDSPAVLSFLSSLIRKLQHIGIGPHRAI